MRSIIAEHGLATQLNSGPKLLVSCVWDELQPAQLVEWVLQDALPVRVQLQLHKIIWGGHAVGV